MCIVIKYYTNDAIYNLFKYLKTKSEYLTVLSGLAQVPKQFFSILKHYLFSFSHNNEIFTSGIKITSDRYGSRRPSYHEPTTRTCASAPSPLIGGEKRLYFGVPITERAKDLKPIINLKYKPKHRPRLERVRFQRNTT